MLRRSHRSCRISSVAVVLLCVSALSAGAATDRPFADRRGVRGVGVDLDRARPVSDLSVPLPQGEIRLIEGILVPLDPLAGVPMGAVFLGIGSVHASPTDPVEAHQLETFTGRLPLAEAFESAVLIAPEGLSEGDAPAGFRVPPDVAAEVEDLWREFREAPETRALGVPGRMLAAATDPEAMAGYRFVRVRASAIGPFFVAVRPDRPDPFLVGQFVPEDATSVQRAGDALELYWERFRERARDLRVEDRGQIDVWTSAPAPTPGTRPFDVLSYTLDLHLDDARDPIRLRTDIEVAAVSGDRSVIHLWIGHDVEVDRVVDASTGEDLAFHLLGEHLDVDLGRRPSTGDRVRLTVETHGRVVEIVADTEYRLRSPYLWYPQYDRFDRATYDWTVTTSGGLRALVPGTVAERGQRSIRTRFDRPVGPVTLILGQFGVDRDRAGEIELEIASDTRTGRHRPDHQIDWPAHVAAIVEDFQSRFGVLPFDRLVVAPSLRPDLFGDGPAAFAADPMDRPGAFDAEPPSGPGVVAIPRGELTVLDRGVRQERKRRDLPDVLARAVAGQWWKEAPAWSGYRDEWAGEALGIVSAALYTSDRIERPTGPRMPLQRGALRRSSRRVRLDRPGEHLGPIVIGRRLDTSQAQNLFRLLAGAKGGAALMTVLRSIPDEADRERSIRDAYAALLAGPADWETLLERLGTDATVPIGPIAGVLVRRTGVPEAEIAWRDLEGGGVRVEAQGFPAYRKDVRVVDRGDGRLDTRLVGRPLYRQVPGIRMSVPCVASWREREDWGPRSSWTSNDEFDLADRFDRIEIELGNDRNVVESSRPERPLALLTQADDLAWVFTVDVDRHPVRAALWRGRRLYMEGKADEARAVLETSRDLPSRRDPDVPRTTTDRTELKIVDRIERNAVELLLARILLDAGEVDAAERAFARANDTMGGGRAALEPDVTVVQARLELARGHAKSARRLLERILLTNDPRDRRYSAEGYAVLAIASRQTGDAETYREAWIRARRYGVDLGPLEVPGADGK